jgi:pectinesterase
LFVLGNQDTLQYLEKALRTILKTVIEGTTDFIFETRLSENCIIKSKKKTPITAASTPKIVIFGYVFKNCKLIESTDAVYLGRPYLCKKKTVFITRNGKTYQISGWDNWSKPEAEKTSLCRIHCTEKDFKPSFWSHHLTKSEAANIL